MSPLSKSGFNPFESQLNIRGLETAEAGPAPTDDQAVAGPAPRVEDDHTDLPEKGKEEAAVKVSAALSDKAQAFLNSCLRVVKKARANAECPAPDDGEQVQNSGSESEMDVEASSDMPLLDPEEANAVYAEILRGLNNVELLPENMADEALRRQNEVIARLGNIMTFLRRQTEVSASAAPAEEAAKPNQQSGVTKITEELLRETIIAYANRTGEVARKRVHQAAQDLVDSNPESWIVAAVLLTSQVESCFNASGKVLSEVYRRINVIFTNKFNRPLKAPATISMAIAARRLRVPLQHDTEAAFQEHYQFVLALLMEAIRQGTLALLQAVQLSFVPDGQQVAPLQQLQAARDPNVPPVV